MNSEALKQGFVGLLVELFIKCEAKGTVGDLPVVAFKIGKHVVVDTKLEVVLGRRQRSPRGPGQPSTPIE